MNCLTINTDASFNSQQKVGGYAFYVVCDSFKLKKSGVFKTSPKNSLEAEMMCIANAVYLTSIQKELPPLKKLIINSDALLAFERVGHGKMKPPIGRKIAALLSVIKRRTGFEKYEFRHVKAHSGIQDARSLANDWCDKEAKRWMRLAVSKNGKQ